MTLAVQEEVAPTAREAGAHETEVAVRRAPKGGPFGVTVTLALPELPESM